MGEYHDLVHELCLDILQLPPPCLGATTLPDRLSPSAPTLQLCIPPPLFVPLFLAPNNIIETERFVNGLYNNTVTSWSDHQVMWLPQRDVRLHFPKG